MNKKYHVTSFSIQHQSASHYQVAGSNVKLPGPKNLAISLDIVVPNADDLDMIANDGTSELEMFEKFLSGINYDWCTPEMLHDALKQKYPERFL